MFYTVISKSGWQGDFWRIQETFESKAKADALKTEIFQRRDATQPHYNVQIKRHHKSLAQLMDDADGVRFNDGTWAAWDF